MPSKSLAVKHRPIRVADMVGQDQAKSIAETLLRKAKAGQDIPGTLMLSGDTGLGKTTMARCIARALNCETGDGCTTCSSCMQFDNPDMHPDFFEVNASDRRGIDDVRSFKQLAVYAPTYNTRVILLDECLPPDTLILTGQGIYASIKSIINNNTKYPTVMAHNITTGEIAPKAVINSQIVSIDKKDMVKVVFSDDSHQICTSDHKIWDADKFGWTQAQDLQPGVKLLRGPQEETGGDIFVLRVEPLSKEQYRDYYRALGQDEYTNDPFVYDIGVADHHNFFVLPKNGTTPVKFSNSQGLTPQAKESILKTLEEPPPQTLFMLATTNPEKMSRTVVNRALKLNLEPVDAEILAKHLSKIAKGEGIKIDKKIAMDLALLSNGLVRDAISTLEKMLAVIETDGKVSKKDVQKAYELIAQDDTELAAIRVLLGAYTGDASEIIKGLSMTKDITGLLTKMTWMNGYVIYGSLQRSDSSLKNPYYPTANNKRLLAAALGEVKKPERVLERASTLSEGLVRLQQMLLQPGLVDPRTCAIACLNV